MVKAKVYLTNGEVAGVDLDFSNTMDWIDSLITRGIRTEDSYIPHHSIYYILFEDVFGKKLPSKDSDVTVNIGEEEN